MVDKNSTIVTATNPVYSKADNSTIDCTVTFNTGEVYPYTAAAFDDTSYGQQLWADLIAGGYGPIAPYVAPSS